VIAVFVAIDEIVDHDFKVSFHKNTCGMRAIRKK
jgi:hypothetical protein